MKTLYAVLAAVLMCCTGCAVQLQTPINVIAVSKKEDRPQVKIPVAMRQHNWLGNKGEGCCVHATMVMLFRHQGRPGLAEYWLQNEGNGSWDEDLAARFDRKHVNYAYTSGKGDVKFLEWACLTHRGCGVAVQGAQHMVLLCHIDKQWCGIIDNNHEDHIEWVPRQTFISEWLNSDSWAVTPVYSPLPPTPSH